MTPEAGRTSYWVVADAPGDLVTGNDVVRTELVANPAADASVLVVDNDLGWTQEQTVQASLLALGVPHDVVEGEPDADTLAGYDAAIWLTSGVSGATGVLSPAGWDAITSYLDGGGKVWLASNRAVGYASAPAVARSAQLAEYFGVVGDNNILDPLGDVMTGQGDAIGGSRDVLMSYIDGRPYLDYFHLATEVAEAPAAPRGEVTGLFVHEQRPDAYVGARLDADEFQTVVTPAPTGIARGADQVALAGDVMDAFGIATPGPDRADTRVAHNRFQHVQTGKPWEVTVGAPSADAAAFVYRVHGDDDWTRMALDEAVDGPVDRDRSRPPDVTNNGLDYYVQVVTDGQRPRRRRRGAPARRRVGHLRRPGRRRLRGVRLAGRRPGPSPVARPRRRPRRARRATGRRPAADHRRGAGAGGAGRPGRRGGVAPPRGHPTGAVNPRVVSSPRTISAPKTSPTACSVRSIASGSVAPAPSEASDATPLSGSSMPQGTMPSKSVRSLVTFVAQPWVVT